MWQVQGTELPATPWTSFTIDKELLYYDGPRLILRRSGSGTLYLVWWCDSDAQVDRWLYLPISPRRLEAVLSGRIPAREAIENPEDSYIYAVDVDPSGVVKKVILASPEALPPDMLPSPEVRINIPIKITFESIAV